MAIDPNRSEAEHRRDFLGDWTSADSSGAAERAALLRLMDRAEWAEQEILRLRQLVRELETGFEARVSALEARNE